MPRNRECFEYGAKLNRETVGQMVKRIIGAARAQDHTKNGTCGGATVQKLGDLGK